MRRAFTPMLVFLLGCPTAGFAQGTPTSAFTPAACADDLFATERARVLPHLGVGASLVVDYAHSVVPVGNDPPLEHRTAVSGVVSLGLFERLQGSLSAPVMVRGGAAPVGPLRADLRVRLWGVPHGGFGRFGLALTALVPTSAQDGGVGLNARALLELTQARDFAFLVNVGVTLRGASEARATARAGVSLPVVPRVLLTAEALLDTALTRPFAQGATALELYGGLRTVSRRGFAVGLAAGPRLLSGPGAADLRALAMVGYAQPPPDRADPAGDRDLDGVEDPVDRCPDEPQGPHPDPEARGCPARDRDRDGVLDRRDRCPDEPEGDDPDPTRVGCPRLDDDRDGVPNAEDLCPEVPRGDNPDPSRRGCPRADRDEDGIPDDEDQCPLLSAGRHPDPERRGCPDDDPDRDGIPNATDACPEEPGPRTRDARTHGCPRVALQGDRIALAQQPRFATDRDLILPVSAGLLREVAAVLEAHPELRRVEVSGHTDDRGDDAHNLDLSQRRAESIRRWLLGVGIAPERLEARGYGETRPLAANDSAAGRALNRRVEFVVRERAQEGP